jgi:hypothetical protein
MVMRPTLPVTVHRQNVPQLVKNSFRLFEGIRKKAHESVDQTGDNILNEQSSAETLALRAVVWLLEDSQRTQGFLAATGADPSDLATRAADPGFLGAVLDHLLADDGLVTGFCDSAGLPYTAPMRARMHLPGFSQMHWT